MLTFCFILMFFLVHFFALIQLRLIGERLNQVSIVSITTVALFMFSVIGTFVLFFQLDEYRYYTGIRNPSLVLEVLFYSSINIIFFLFGVMFFRRFIGFDVLPFRSVEIKSLTWRQEKLLLVLLIFCILILCYYLCNIDRIAIFALAEGAGAANLARSDMGNSFIGKYHWYKLIMYDLGNLLTFTFFAIYLFKKKFGWLTLFLISFCYSMFVAVMATEKAPVAWLLVGLFMVYFLVKSNGVIPFRIVIPFAMFLVFLLIITYIYFMGAEDVGSALWSVFSRAFSGSISPAYFYLEFFPEHQDFLFGRTFPNPGGLMPYTPYNYTVEVMNWVFPEDVSSGVVGTMPTVFWGEAYANFGPSGIPIVAFIVGGLLAFVSYLVSRVEINPLTIAFLVWLILIFKDLAVTGFSGYLYSIYIISISAVVIVLLVSRGSIRIRTKVLS